MFIFLLDISFLLHKEKKLQCMCYYYTLSVAVTVCVYVLKRHAFSVKFLKGWDQNLLYDGGGGGIWKYHSLWQITQYGWKQSTPSYFE